MRIKLILTTVIVLLFFSSVQNCVAQQTNTVNFPGFSWDRVPLNLHFAKRSSDLTDDEVEFIAAKSDFICLEKGHGALTHGSTEAGIADSARRIVAANPDAKVLFYFNAFINWPSYQSFDSYEDQWTLRKEDGEVVTHSSGTARPDPSNAEFRRWWSDVVVSANRKSPSKGVFVDAVAQVLAPSLAKRVGEEKAAEIVVGMRKMIAMTKRRLGPQSTVLVNGLRGENFREILNWKGVDGVMIEHFGAFGSKSPEEMKTDLESIAIAGSKGKFVVLKGWPGFNWMDREKMKRPHAELLEQARDGITFPLACFLIAAEEGSHFCYSWGYTHTTGMLDDYPELDRKLGPPQGVAEWTDLTATRQFEHASVWIDLEKKEARIDWREVE